MIVALSGLFSYLIFRNGHYFVLVSLSSVASGGLCFVIEDINRFCVIRKGHKVEVLILTLNMI